MKWVTSLLISCSLAVAGAVYAQQPDEQASPIKGDKHVNNKNQQRAGENQPGGTNANPKQGRRTESAGAQQQGQEATPGRNGRRGNNRAEQNGEKPGGEANPNAPREKANEGAEANKTNEANSTPNAKEQTREGRAGKNARNRENPAANASPNGTANEERSDETREGRAGKNARNQQNPTANAPERTGAAATSNARTNTNVNANVRTEQQTNNTSVAGDARANGRGKKVEPQQVQQIRQQHVSFHAQPRPDRAPTATFNANFRIEGADRWQGPQYEAYRLYRPERHDQGWYRSRYSRVELIGGGYYYWNNGYWYPAWGYDQGHEYYAYDGPVYVGQRAEPPDQVIADVQSELQQMGYYQGDVDGLLGPMTRDALTAYQQDENLATTATIDEPTLGSLGMSS